MNFDVDELAKVTTTAEKLGMVVEDSTGTSSDMHPGMFILLAGMAGYHIDSDTATRTQGLMTLDALLSIARNRGFAQSDTLRALLAKGDYSESTMYLARDAMHPVTREELATALRRGGFVEE